MVSREQTNANREYKDSLFTALFSDEDALRELYNALTGSAYGPEVSVVITTLPDIFYRLQKNDLAFVIDGRLVILIEHQSTLNPNMPLRIFLYVAGVYKMLIDQRALYGKKVWLPRPEFYVLYNGTEELADETVLRLSDSFLEVEGHEGIDLEVTVKVYNINHGHNEGLSAKCEALRGYGVFVAIVREELGSEREAERKTPEERREALGRAIRKAINYCVKHGILKEFIEKHAGEVINMLTMEFDINIAEQVWKEEAWEEGRKAGKEAGIKQNQAEILELMAQVKSLEEFEQLRARLQAAL